MEILHVTNFFKPSWESGGVASVCYEISKNLLLRGNEVTVYTTDGFKSRLNVQVNQPVEVDGIKVYYFYNLIRILVKTLKLTTPYYLPFVLRKEIQKFDVIHIHEHRTLPAVFVYYYAQKYKIPYVLQSHGSVLPFLQKQDLKRIFDLFFGYNILKGASKIIALNETEKSQYIEMGVDQSRIEIIPNGIDLSKYTNLPEKGKFREKYKICINEKIVLYLGRIHKNKGIDLLIGAFTNILKSRADTKLIIIGPDDGYKQSLIEYIHGLEITHELEIQSKVLFTGFVTNDQKIEALVDSDVFVTPSFSGFPVTFLEACACSVPIITTKKGDSINWIDGNVGYVVEYNASELQNSILKILESEELQLRFGNNGRNLIESTFNVEKVLDQTIKMYKTVVCGHNEEN